MKETALISTPDSVELEVPLAGPLSRFLAFVVDQIILMLLWIVVLVTVLSGSAFSFDELGGMALAIVVAFIFMTTWGYCIFFEWAMRGQTPGKRLAGLRVIREDGLPVGAREVWLRNLCRAVDMWPPPTYTVGFMAAMADPLGRRLGDLVAGTIVVRDSLHQVESTKSGAAWAERAERGESHQALVLTGGSLSARQVAAIEQFLERRQELSIDKQEELAERMLRPIEGILGEELRDLRVEHGSQRVLERLFEMAQLKEKPMVTPVVVARGPLF